MDMAPQQFQIVRCRANDDTAGGVHVDKVEKCVVLAGSESVKYIEWQFNVKKWCTKM